MALMEACLVVLRGREGQSAVTPFYRPSVTVLWRVVDALARIRNILPGRPDGAELKAFLPTIAADEPEFGLRARAAIASSFVAALELTRIGEITVDQIEGQATIYLHTPP